MKSAEKPAGNVELSEQDRAWTGGKLISLGVVTLAIALTIIVSAAAQTGCGVAWVP